MGGKSAVTGGARDISPPREADAPQPIYLSSRESRRDRKLASIESAGDSTTILQFIRYKG